MPKLLRCGKLIDGNGKPGKLDMALYIEGTVIKDVMSWDKVPTADKESYIDYSEFVVVPGFIDAHVHLVATALQDHEATREAWVSATHAELMAVAARNCIDSLLGGVTTVRDLGDIDFVTLSARDLVKSGVIPGPTIFAAGPPVTTTAGHLHWCGNTADTLDEIRKAVRNSCAKEVDVIKVMSSGGNATRGSNPLMPQYEIEELKVLVNEAHRLKRRVAAHSHGSLSIRRCIAAGVDTIEHCTWKGSTDEDNDPQTLVNLLKGSETMVTLTLAGIHRALVDFNRPLTDVVAAAAKGASVSGDLRTDFNWAKALIANGIDVALASDAGARFTSFRDFNESIEAAIIALDVDFETVISMSTKIAAKAVGISDTVGTLEKGMLADIAVLKQPVQNRKMGSVQDVYKHGKKMVENGNLVIAGNDSFGTLN
jgi:cytosine/adenosine deaminase-related metal-dependent hydrolase